MPRVSFIVSAFDRPASLRLCLSSLIIQTLPDLEIIVMDNSEDDLVIYEHRRLCVMDRRIRHFSPKAEGMKFLNCYYSSEYAALNLAAGEWVGFPSDDSWYSPYYAEKLLWLADRSDLELVYCNLIMESAGGNGVLNCEARACHVDKTNFLLKRSRFFPWPGKHPEGLGSCSDGNLIDELAAQGIRHGKVPQLLAVHM